MDQELRVITCCQKIPHAVGAPISSSLLGRMLVTGYYNGPMSGFLQCPRCESAYCFHTVDWSHDKFTRIIALRPVSGESMQRLIAFFAEVPTWPEWIPKKMQSPSDAELDTIEAFTHAIISKAGPAQIVVAWSVENHRVLTARRLDPTSLPMLVDLLDLHDVHPRHDWFCDLELSHDPWRAETQKGA